MSQQSIKLRIKSSLGPDRVRDMPVEVREGAISFLAPYSVGVEERLEIEIPAEVIKKIEESR